MDKFIRIGVDLAKNYFQVHAIANEDGPGTEAEASSLEDVSFSRG